MFSPYIQMPLRFHAFENVIARAVLPRRENSFCLSFADRGLQNVHHVAAFVRFNFSSFSFSSARTSESAAGRSAVR